MIKSIYILSRNGILLYSKNFMEEQYDQNILIGFFTSIANFSREALESVVRSLDLGGDNKLILETKPEENIFGAAIVNPRDNEDLISKLMLNILQDFIDDFSPEYDIDVIQRGKMEEILEDNLRGKTSYSIPIRFVLSWFILAPLAVILTILNILATQIFILASNQGFFTLETMLTRTLPQMVLISFVELIVVFGGANLISGYVTLNLKLAAINSFLYFVMILLSYFFSVEPVLIYIILAFFPLIIIISLGAAYMGYRLALRNKLIKD